MYSTVLFVLATVSIIGGILLKRKADKTDQSDKKNKRNAKLGLIWLVIGIYVLLVNTINTVFGPAEKGALEIKMSADRIDFHGFSLSTTIVNSWIIMAILIILAIILRIVVIPRLKTIPTGIQNILEIAVDGIRSYTGSQVKGLGENLPAYLFTLVLFLIGCAASELFGVPAPTADITLTFALALVTFILINYYGIKVKGLKGRIKSLSDPTPIVMPLRMISDLAIPVSMACRLFGNMLGGMIVMDLLYHSLGNLAIGVPSVIGLYFNVFHPLIQAFIFVTLTLTFVNEAVEEVE